MRFDGPRSGRTHTCDRTIRRVAKRHKHASCHKTGPAESSHAVDDDRPIVEKVRPDAIDQRREGDRRGWRGHVPDGEAHEVDAEGLRCRRKISDADRVELVILKKTHKRARVIEDAQALEVAP